MPGQRNMIAVVFSLIAFAFNIVTAETQTQTLAPFIAFTSELPFTGEIRYSDDGSYRLSITADSASLDNVLIQPGEGNLALLRRNQSSVSVIRQSQGYFTVWVPRGVLKSVAQRGDGSLEVAGLPIDVSGTLNVILANFASMRLNSVEAPEVNIDHGGSGKLVLSGTPKRIIYKCEYGLGDSYFDGPTDSMQITNYGTGFNYIRSKGSNVVISGSITGRQQVKYTQGTCTVGSRPDYVACQQVSSISIPATIGWLTAG